MDTKPYDIPENDSSKVEEPALAYKTEVDLLHQEAIDLLMQIDNSALLQEIINELTYHITISEPGSSPIQFTLEELKDQLAIAQEESRLGLGVDHEEILKREPQWWMSK